jgi:hypothetical protein
VCFLAGDVSDLLGMPKTPKVGRFSGCQFKPPLPASPHHLLFLLLPAPVGQAAVDPACTCMEQSAAALSWRCSSCSKWIFTSLGLVQDHCQACIISQSYLLPLLPLLLAITIGMLHVLLTSAFIFC